jgi:hypothetical protein
MTRRLLGATDTDRCDMQDKTQTATKDALVSRRQAVMGLAALLAAGSGLAGLRGVAAREAEPGDDHGGHGKDDHGRRHRRRHHGRRHK